MNSRDKTLTFARLYGEYSGGRLGRRELLKRAGGLGLGATALAMVGGSRSAYGQGTPAAGGEVGYSLSVPEGLRTDLGGTKIKAILASSAATALPWEMAAIAAFTEATGIEVEHVAGEESATDRLQVYTQQFAAQAADNDVYQIDVIWPGVVAEHAIDLNESLSDLASQHFQAIVENNTVDGKLVGMPQFTDAGLLYFRTDLLEQYGLEAPTTWEELTAAAQTIQDGERGANPDFYGFVFQGNAYEGLTCNGLEWQVSNGGGNIIEPDGTISINNEQAIAAFEMAAGWVNVIAPQGVSTYQEADSLNVWINGNAAFMRNWPYAFAASQDETQSQIAGKIDVSPLPMGSGEGARHADTLGGWQLMVSQYSENQEAAVEFVRFMCSPEVQKSRAIEVSNLPTIGSVYEDPDVAAASEFIPRLRDVFEGGAVARPSSVTGEFYPEVSAVYFTELNQVLTGAKDASQAVEDMASQFEPIMEDAGY